MIFCANFGGMDGVPGNVASGFGAGRIASEGLEIMAEGCIMGADVMEGAGVMGGR